MRRLREGAAYPGTKTNLCVPGGAEAAKKLAEVLGVEAEAVEPKVAIVRCGGDCEHTSPKEDYRGIASCLAAKLFFGGKGTCTYGCLGFGDCAKVCPHDAISWNNGIAAIDQSVCVGCGLCAKTCPQQVIAIIPQSAKTAVLCSNHDKGAVTRKACSAGCIGCMKCVKTCEHDAVHVEVTSRRSTMRSVSAAARAHRPARPVRCTISLRTHRHRPAKIS